jgi:hypothetical protein
MSLLAASCTSATSDPAAGPSCGIVSTLATTPTAAPAPPSDDYTAGYAYAFVAVQAGVYDFGRVEAPVSQADFDYNDGIDAGQDDAMNRRPPTTEVTEGLWIGGYLKGNPAGWADGANCVRSDSHSVAPGTSPIEEDGWYVGYEAGFESACESGTPTPSWVGEAVCPYDPWEGNAIDQDVVCPPVHP